MAEPTIGELNRKIAIEQLTQGKDSEGGITNTWSAYAADIWASIDNFSGNEPFITRQGGGRVGVSRVLFKMRYISGVDSTMRIVYNGANYAIKHVSNWKEKNTWLYIECETGKNEGH